MYHQQPLCIGYLNSSKIIEKKKPEHSYLNKAKGERRDGTGFFITVISAIVNGKGCGRTLNNAEATALIAGCV